MFEIHICNCIVLMCLCGLFALSKMFRSDYICYDSVLILENHFNPMLTRFRRRATALSQQRAPCSWISNDCVTLCTNRLHRFAFGKVHSSWLCGRSILTIARKITKFHIHFNNHFHLSRTTNQNAIDFHCDGNAFFPCSANLTKRVHFDCKSLARIRSRNRKCACILISRKMQCIEYIRFGNLIFCAQLVISMSLKRKCLNIWWFDSAKYEPIFNPLLPLLHVHIVVIADLTTDSRIWSISFFCAFSLWVSCAEWEGAFLQQISLKLNTFFLPLL